MAGDAPYRRPGKAVSPALARLAEQGAERARPLPRDAERLSSDQRRAVLEQVFDVHDGQVLAKIGFLAFIVWSMVIMGCCASMGGGNLGTLAGGALSSAVAIAAPIAFLSKWQAMRREETIAARLGWAARQPFPVHGYELWCLSHEPLLDVTLSAPIDRQQLADALATIAPPVALTWLDDRRVRVMIPATRIARGEGPVERHANPDVLESLVARLLVPLHADVPIERIDMGGARDC